MRVTIESPVPGEVIGGSFLVKGRLDGRPPAGHQLWIIHRREQHGIFWPKLPSSEAFEGKEFEERVFDGGAPGDVLVEVVCVDNDTAGKFRDWIRLGERTGDFQGIDPAQFVLGELAQVKVFRAGVPLNVFISYSHQDRPAFDRIVTVLSALKRRQQISVWTDNEILPGEDFGDRISEALKLADVFIPLVSYDYLASDYCYSKEMQEALARKEAGSLAVLPVIIRSCTWQESPLGSLKALPLDGFPVEKFRNRDEAWTQIEEGIFRVLKRLSTGIR